MMSAAFTRLNPSILTSADGLLFMREDCLSGLLDKVFRAASGDAEVVTAWRDSRCNGEVRSLADGCVQYFCIADADRFIAKHAPSEMAISQRLEQSALEKSLRLTGSWCRERDAIAFRREQLGGSLREHHAWLKRDRRRRAPEVPFWTHFDEIRYAWDDLYRCLSRPQNADAAAPTSTAEARTATAEANTIVDYAHQNRLMVQITVRAQDEWMGATITPTEARSLATRLTEIADACNACEFDAEQWRVVRRGTAANQRAPEVAQ